MNQPARFQFRRTTATITAAVFVSLGLCLAVWAQESLSEPVYRVADTSASSATPSASVAATAAAPADKAPVDLTQQPNEHPLAPVIRALKTSQESIDENIRDYSCTFVKQERVDGELGERQYIFMKVMHEPFSVYMSFLKPYAGREVVYVAGQNDHKMIAREAGVKRILGKMNLDPEGALAMKGQRHPITSVGIRNLSGKLARIFEAEALFAECDVTVNAETKINDRPTTMVQIVHPKPRQNFHAHVSRIFFDNELRIPIHYDAYSWPTTPGGQPPLEESYTYQNLKINNSFTARDFDAYNNPEIFKP